MRAPRPDHASVAVFRVRMWLFFSAAPAGSMTGPGVSDSQASGQEGPDAGRAIGVPRMAASETKGLLRRSAPKVEVGPCPGTKVTSSPSGHSLVVMACSRLA